MTCLECNTTEIDFYISSTIITRKYESKGKTGRFIRSIFNPIDQRPYRIICSKCKDILREVEK